MFGFGKISEKEKQRRAKEKEKIEAAKDSAGIMREEMGKHGWNVFKGYKEGRKKVMEKHGELIIEHTAE